MRKVTISCFSALLLLYSHNALATGGYYYANGGDGAEDILEKYPNWPDSSRCAACHYWQSPSSANLNPFGLKFKANKNLSAIAGADADGDGRSNGVELSAGTLPGLKSLPPAGVAASDGTYTDKVRVSWSLAATLSGWMPSSLGNTSSYSIYRALESAPVPQDVTLGSPLAKVAASQTSYDDLTAVKGTKYRYWVSATTPGGQSKAGGAVIGMAKALVFGKFTPEAAALGTKFLKSPQSPGGAILVPKDSLKSPQSPSALKPSALKSVARLFLPPGKIYASNGVYGHKIVVKWAPVPGTVKYIVYRTKSEKTGLGWQERLVVLYGFNFGTVYHDATVQREKPGTKFFYHVFSCSYEQNKTGKCSKIGSNSGYRKAVFDVNKIDAIDPNIFQKQSTTGRTPRQVIQKGSTTVRTPGQIIQKRSTTGRTPGQLSPPVGPEQLLTPSSKTRR